MKFVPLHQYSRREEIRSSAVEIWRNTRKMRMTHVDEGGVFTFFSIFSSLANSACICLGERELAATVNLHWKVRVFSRYTGSEGFCVLLINAPRQ